MGASSPVDDLACSDPDDGQVTDGAFGAGLYCTDPANVTVTAGANFASRKWVAGNPGARLVQRRHRRGRAGRRRPGCLSLDGQRPDVHDQPVHRPRQPRRAFHYVLRVQNAGTESALQMTIVDTFPAPGDTGVLGAARGTQWATAPTLAGPATYSGPATGDDRVHDRARRAPAACSSTGRRAAPTWTPRPGRTTTALRLPATFDPDPLPPGGTVDVSFTMNAPARRAARRRPDDRLELDRPRRDHRVGPAGHAHARRRSSR